MDRLTITPSDVLVCVDVQNDFCEGGALAVPGADEAFVAAVSAFASMFENVVLTQDWHPQGHVSFASTHAAEPFSTIEIGYGTQVMWPDHCLQGSPGAAFHPALCIPHAQSVIRKGYRTGLDSYSGFIEADGHTPTGLEGYLRERGLGRIVVVGLATDYCVSWTARDARGCGFETYVVEDLCRAIDIEGSLAAAWSAMDEGGVRRTTSAGISDISAI